MSLAGAPTVAEITRSFVAGPESSFAVTAYGPSASMAVMPRIDLHAHSNRSTGRSPRPRSSGSHQNATSTSSRSPTTTRPTGSTRRSRPGPSSVSRSCPIKLSAEHEATSVHAVLCYWMDPANEGLQGRARGWATSGSAGGFLSRSLGALGVPIEFEHVQRIANGATIVRPHVAQAMVEIAVATEKEAFDVYLGDGRPGHVLKHALDPVDAVALILGAGGGAVLAHPGMWGDQTSVPVELIKRMAAAGPRGLRGGPPGPPPRTGGPVPSAGGSARPVATGGSDCHGARYEPVRLGTSLCRPEAFDELRGAAVR